MKNLVSKNPVLRFKLGRKIIFAKPGDKMLYNGKEVVTEEILDGQTIYRRKNGSYVYSNDKLLSPIKQNSLVSPSIKPSDVTVNIPKLFPENKELFVSLYLKDVTYNWLEGLRNKYVRPFLKTTVIPQLLTQTQKTNTKAISKIAPKTPINWDTEFYNQFTKNLTGQLRAYLDNAGVDYSNAASMQEYLKNKGFDLGKNGVDARWGKNSRKAWNDFVSKTNFGSTLPSNISSVILTTPAPIDTSKININIPQLTHDRTGIREYLRSKGLNPYSFSGALRRALRMVMNGQGTDNDKLLVKGMNIFKQGGLISKDPIKRFKLKNFLVSGPVTTLKTGGSIPKLLHGKYIVKKGDNLWNIAKNNNMSLLDLLNINKNIKSPDNINIGQEINISKKSSSAPNYLLRENNNNKINLPSILSTATKEFFPSYNKKTSSKKIVDKTLFKQKPKKEQTLKERYWSLTPSQRSAWVGEDMNTYANTPEYRAEFDRYKPTKTSTGTVYRSRLGDLGLVANNNGTYSLYDKNGNLIDKCAQTTNALLEMLLKHQNVIGNAWDSLGMYGDSMLVNGYKYLPKIGGYNKFKHTALNMLAAAAVQSQLNNLDLLTGDVVGLYSANSDYNDRAWNEGTRNRSNSHEGLVFRPSKDKNLTYIIHNINGKVFVDPMSKFMVSESGLLLDWAPTYVMRPNQGQSQLEIQKETPLTYKGSKNGKLFYDYLTIAGKKKYGVDINKEYALIDNKPVEL